MQHMSMKTIHILKYGHDDLYVAAHSLSVIYLSLHFLTKDEEDADDGEDEDADEASMIQFNWSWMMFQWFECW